VIGPWYVALVRPLVPAHWRDDVTNDLIDEARLHGRSGPWLVWHLLRVGVTMRWSLARDSVSADVRYAIRSLAAARWFTVGTVLTFMLGVGVNIAVFAAVDRLVFRPLPYADPESLVLLRACDRTTGDCTAGSFPAAVSFQLLRHSTTIGDVAVAGFSRPYELEPNGTSDVRLSLIAVSPRVLRVLKARLVTGRDIADEEIASKAAVGWISYDTWRLTFQQSPAIVGQTLWAGTKAVTVLGVLPADFIPPAWSAPNPGWAGLVVDHDGREWAGISPSGRSLAPFARLRPGVTVAQAQSEVQALAESIRPDGAATPAEYLRVDRLGTALFSGVRRYIWLVVTAAWLVLIIACANLAGLFLARSRSRERVGAISKALGASPSRLMAISFFETLIVCIFGTGLALLVLAAVQTTLAHVLPPMFSRYNAGLGDWRVIGFAVLATFATAVLAGAIPAMRLAREDPLPFLQRGSWNIRRRRVVGSRTLVVVEAAVGAVLVLGAVLALRSFSLLTHDDLGLNVDGLYVARLSGTARLPFEQQLDRMRQVADAASRLGHVEAAGIGDWIPTSGPRPMRGFAVNGRRGALVQVSARYFDALGTPVLAGRSFSEKEVATRASLVILNEAAARLYWPGVALPQVIGRSWDASPGPSMSVIGVTANAKRTYGQLQVDPVAFVPLGTAPTSLQGVVIRVAPSRVLRVADLRGALAARLSGVQVSISKERDAVDVTLDDPRFRAVLLGALALAGLLLAAAGLFAVTSYDAASRTQEMALRIALGAEPGRVRRLVLTDACVPTAIGACIGLAIAWELARFVQAFMFRTDARESLYYATVAGLLIVTAAAAAWFPARRASHADPIVMLKAQ
jgi:predicted permease